MKEFCEQNDIERDKNSEATIISALEKEIIGMEERKPDIRKEGRGDPKYEILFKFVRESKEKGFDKTYSGLSDDEKHAVITRLENRAYKGDIPYEFVREMSRKLYGIRIYEGKKYLNRERQSELEDIIQNKWTDYPEK